MASIPVTVPHPSRLKRYAAVVARWVAITFVIFVITLWTGKYITENALTKTYTATAEIQVNSSRLEDVAPPFSESDSASYFHRVFESMLSPEFLLPIIKDLGLDKTWAQRVFKSDKEGLSDQEALAYMDKFLKINATPGTNVIRITVSSDDPKETADIANAIADRYKAKRDTEEDQAEIRGMNTLRQQIAEQQKVVDQSKSSSNPDLQKESNMLEALNTRLKEYAADSKHIQSPVRIVSRATAPENPSSPNRVICFFIAVGVAAVISVVAGCFIEVILLFVRAAEGEHS